MRGQPKDYYTILEVHPSATAQEIKKAYRKLAFKYHPDTSQHNTYTEIHFREIQEAYDVLSDEVKRKRYDEERWLSGMSSRARHQHVITPPWILKEAQRLTRHMATVDTYRMSHSALSDYVFLLLSDSHMAILQQADDRDTNKEIVNELLKATSNLKYQYMDAIAARLVQLSGADNALHASIYAHVRNRRAEATWERYLPLIIAIITLVLVVVMWWWGKRN
ncbi:J domain-containing protein [Polluticoccus soli]|uniref:J domain-containing protein n=1 Tax=Polluticoccus soli TaxID=3034150 RepID=UPI0023E26DBA|nr:DnaJ domain-containing protein [Flavipsychrobacter sp. JY13-12]